MDKGIIIVLGMLSKKELAWKTLNDKKGYRVVLIEEYKNKAITGYFQEKYFVKDLIDSSQLIEVINKKIINDSNIVAIVTFTEHLVTVAEELGNRYNITSIQNSIYARDKSLMRKRLASKGIKQPVFLYYDSIEQISNLKLPDIKFPLVLKPNTYTASMGVKKINNLDELNSQIKNNKLYSLGLLLEEYVEGNEYSCEGFVQNNNVTILSTTRKIIEIKNGYFIEKGHVLPVNIENIKYKDWITEVIQSLELNNCVFHLEFKHLENGEFAFIEIGARPGGGFIPDMLLGHSGVNLYEISIDIALGKSNNLFSINTNTNHQQNYRAIGFVLNNSSNVIDLIEGLNKNDRLMNVSYKLSDERNKDYASNLDRDYFIEFISSSEEDATNIINKL